MVRYGVSWSGDMFYVYILISLVDGNFYVGYSGDLRARYKKHILGRVKSTKYRRPLKMLCYEAYLIIEEAMARERYLKSSDARKELRIRLKKSLNNIDKLRKA